ncbi:LacI family DNA-binding transcriptional regulator [Brachybacterium sp. DNPG3]
MTQQDPEGSAGPSAAETAPPSAPPSAPRRRVTIKDVAAEAGVSFKTVSNVLNRTGSMRPETRDRVLAAMAELGFSVNASARSLKRGSSGLIGLAVIGFTQPFIPMLSQRIIDEARARGYNVIIDSYDGDMEEFQRTVGEMNMLPADGWILFAGSPLGARLDALNQQLPYVVAGDWLAHGRADHVTVPNADAVRVATGRLLDRGHRRIALLGGPPLGELDLALLRSAIEGTGGLRAKGFAQAFTDRGLDIPWELLLPVEDVTYENGVDGVRRLLALETGERPDAILCLNDAVGLGALRELARQGIRVPEDVAVVGFDNVTESAYSTPSLSTIDTDLEDFARAAVSMLVERIGGHDGPARRYTTAFTLVERESARF